MSGLELKTNTHRYLYPPTHNPYEDFPQQEAMNRILEEAGEKRKNKAEQPAKGYMQFDFADMELLAKPELKPSFNLKLSQIAPSTNEIIGAVRGIEGHFLYELYMHLLKIYRGNKNITLADLKNELLTENWVMKEHERILLTNIVETRFRSLKKIVRRDLPDIVRIIRGDWRLQHAFLEKRVRFPKKAMRPKITYINGLFHKAKYIRGIWNSEEQLEFGEKVIEALFSDTMALHFPLETVPENQISIECPKSLLVHLPNGYMIQTRFRPDIICVPRELNEENGESSGIVKVDAKFGKWEAKSKSALQQTFFSNTGILLSVLQHVDYPQAIKLEKMNPERVNSIYSVIDTSLDEPKMEVQDGNLLKGEVEEIKENLMSEVVYFATYRPFYDFVAKLRKQAAVMPYIPEEPMGDDVPDELY